MKAEMNNRFKFIKYYFVAAFYCLLYITRPVYGQAGSDRLDSIQIARIADFGKVWGVINYFHPAAGKGILNTDSLVIANVEPLITNPTSVNFKRSLAAMFSMLADPYSGIIKKVIPENKSTLHKSERSLIFKSTLPSGELYLAAPQEVFQKQLTPDSLLSAILPFSSIIIDLRNRDKNDDFGLKQYTDFVQPLVGRMINRTLILPTSRSFYYHGLIREDFPHDINILSPDEKGTINDRLQVYYGLRNISEGSYLLPGASNISFSQKKFCFIVNKYVNINTLKALLALRNRNGCTLIFEGEMPEYILGDFYTMHLSDSISVKIRTSELLYEDGTLGRGLDLLLPVQTDTSLQASIITQAAQLLGKPIKTPGRKEIENLVYIRKPQYSYPSKDVPDAQLRLLGLFNFWNAIYYFSPNKNLIPFNWDKALLTFIPKFLTAKTDSMYFLSLMELTASIKDGHSILIAPYGSRSPAGIMDGNLPVWTALVNGKVYITRILSDTAQQTSLSEIHEGDELLAIDQLPVSRLADQWKPYMAASNIAGFNREYYATWLTNGTNKSYALLTILSKGKIKTITLRRIKRDDYYNLLGKSNRSPLVPPYCKILEGNIGYMRVNRVYTQELDSLSQLLKNCKSIILDARGYPRDSRIGEVLSSYIAVKTDTVALNKFPFIISPDLSKNYTITEYEIIKPADNKLLKNKKYYLLVDEGVQSQGEGNVIGIQGVTKATTIGTQTAGANGMAITINFPGEYFSYFSGFGEYYPDGIPNQKQGVKIDIPVTRTLGGYLSGKDEILERAIKFIQTKK